MVSLRFSGVAQPNDIPPLAGGGAFYALPSEIFAIIPTFLELATKNWSYLIPHQFYIDGANFVKIGYIFLKR